MGKNCEHKKVKFMGLLQHRQYPEKCFICEDCHAFISDYITSGEMDHFHENKSMSLDLSETV